MAVEVEAAGQVDEFLRVLRRRVWWIVIPFVVIGSLGVFIAVVIPKKYVCRTEVMVRNLNESTGELGQRAAAMEGGVARYNLRSRARIQSVLRSLQIKEYTILDAPEQRDYEDAILADLHVKLPTMPRDSGQQAVEIVYRDTDARRSLDFLTALSRSWQKEVLNGHLERKQKELAETRERLAENQKLLQAITEERAGIRRDFDITPKSQLGDLRIGGAEHQTFQQLKRTESEISDLEDEIKELEVEYELRDRAWARMPQHKAPGEAVDLSPLEQEIQGLEQQILNERLALQQSGWSSSHSDYIKAERSIANLEEKRRGLIENADRTFGEPGEPEVDPDWLELKAELEGRNDDLIVKRRRLETLQQKRTRIQDRADRLQSAIKEIEDLDAEWEALKTSTDAMQAKRDELDVNVKTLDSAEGNPFDILEEPEEPNRPTSPNPYVIAIGAIIAGLGLGLGSAVLKEYSRSCFRSARDLSRVMTHPVLGTVNTIRTRRERARGILVRGMLGGGSLLFVLTVGYVTWAFGTGKEDVLLTDPLVEAVQSLQEAMK